jgi:dihydropteroate synthase
MTTGSQTKIMAVLNVTPDSFSDGGQYTNVDAAVTHAEMLIADGADCIDIGGESTRPGSEPVSAEEELRRVLPVLERLAGNRAVPISIDTYKPEVARVALAAGASILNDVTGLTNPEMLKVAADTQASIVVMHMQGEPKSMQTNPLYADLMADLTAFFSKRIEEAKAVGVTKLILDPGIGFGKTLEHNLTILKRLEEFAQLGFPILVGPSRKSFISTLTGDLPAEQRVEGTIASCVVAAMQGASWVRVHDVKEVKRALLITDAIKNI